MGTKIRQARDARGWTQEQLAEKVGVRRNAVISWEQAPDARSISSANRQKLEHVLEINLNEDADLTAAGALEHFSDGQLIAELAARLAAGDARQTGRPPFTLRGVRSDAEQPGNADQA